MALRKEDPPSTLSTFHGHPYMGDHVGLVSITTPYQA